MLIAIWIAVVIVIFYRLYTSKIEYERTVALPAAVLGASLVVGATHLVDCATK